MFIYHLQLFNRKIFRRCIQVQWYVYRTSCWGVRAPRLRIHDLCAVHGSFLAKTKGGRVWAEIMFYSGYPSGSNPNWKFFAQVTTAHVGGGGNKLQHTVKNLINISVAECTLFNFICHDTDFEKSIKHLMPILLMQCKKARKPSYIYN
jgi:hypothetical protein